MSDAWPPLGLVTPVALNISALTTNDTLVYGVGSSGVGFTAPITRVLLVCFGQQGVTGFVTGPVVSVGTNAPNYNDILAAFTLPFGNGFLASSTYLPAAAAAGLGWAGTDLGIYCHISVAATATLYDFNVMLLAYQAPV